MFPSLILLLAMLACNMPSSWITSVAPGGTWYVDKTGDDSNDCLSATSACLTITAAVSKALTAGVIQIGSGTFEEISTGVPETGLYINNKVLTLRGTLAGGVPETILSGAGTRTTVLVKGSAILIFQDLIIQDGGGSPGIGLKIEGSAGSTAGVELTNVIIRGNGNYGLFITGRATVTLDDVQVLSNRTHGLNASGTAQITIKNSVFSGNTHGAIDNGIGSRMVISDTVISDNSSSYGAIKNQGDMRIERSTISGTLGYDDLGGAGIYSQGSLTVVNTTVAANSGTGISLAGGDLKMTFSTVAENGDYGIDFFSGSFELHNNVVVNNRIQDCYSARARPVTVVSWDPIISDGTCSPSIYIITIRASPDPYLGHLADNGGPTQTMALLMGSAAINNARASGSDDDDYPATDQRGFDRIRSCDGGTHDMGAYEFNAELCAAVLPLIIATPETPIGGVPGVIPLWTETPNPAGFILVVQVPANCRQGPGVVYPVVNSVLPGKQVQVIGKSADNAWWYGRVDNDQCFISNIAGVPSGDLNLLPVIPAPPAPVPTATAVTTFNEQPTQTSEIDFDQDGYGASVDCNDKDAKINPGALETPDDKVDSNCNGDDDT